MHLLRVGTREVRFRYKHYITIIIYYNIKEVHSSHQHHRSVPIHCSDNNFISQISNYYSITINLKRLNLYEIKAIPFEIIHLQFQLSRLEDFERTSR